MDYSWLYLLRRATSIKWSCQCSRFVFPIPDRNRNVPDRNISFPISRNIEFVFPSGCSRSRLNNTGAGTVVMFSRSFPTVFIPNLLPTVFIPNPLPQYLNPHISPSSRVGRLAHRAAAEGPRFATEWRHPAIKKDALDTQATEKFGWTSKPLIQIFLTPNLFRP
jgi:hypothetical protein